MARWGGLERSRWGWVLGLAIVAIVLLGCRSQPQVEPSSAPQAPLAVPERPSPPARPLIGPPRVDAELVFRHVQDLSFERVRSSDRAKAQEYLAQKLRDYGLKPETQQFETGVNLVAERSGSDPGAGAILVTAHYDTVPGSLGQTTMPVL